MNRFKNMFRIFFSLLNIHMLYWLNRFMKMTRKSMICFQPASGDGLRIEGPSDGALPFGPPSRPHPRRHHDLDSVARTESGVTYPAPLASWALGRSVRATTKRNEYGSQVLVPRAGQLVDSRPHGRIHDFLFCKLYNKKTHIMTFSSLS